MTAYTANLTITANTAWGTWYEFSDRACHDTATVYRWYVATFFSAKAQARYQWIGEMLGCIIALAILYTQQWAEAEVQSCLPADHIAGVGNMVEADPFSPAENPHFEAAIRCFAEFTEATAQPRQYSIRELKQMASAAKVRGYGTMTKARLMEALALA